MCDMFARIATRYDLFNDLLSFGVHRATRRVFLDEMALHPGQTVLDVCAGTGALARRAVARGALVVGVDGCEPMLRRLIARTPSVPVVVGDALALPFAEASFDAAMIGFSSRDVASPLRMFREIARVVRPGGLVGNLEFTQPPGRLRRLYHLYLHSIVPFLGGLVDRKAYWFLSESVRRVLSAPDLAAVMRDAGLDDVRFRFCGFGAVAVHLGRVPR